MPKAKWGSDLTEEDINSASDGFTPYAGEVPASGVYRFRLVRSKKGESGSGNPKLYTILELDGSWKSSHKKYDGCPVHDHMPVGKSSAFRSKAFCAGLGVAIKDFLNNTVVDDDGIVTKIGTKTIKKGQLVYANVKREEDESYGVRLVLSGGGYMPAPDKDESEPEPSHGDKPTKAEGKVKGKKNKASAKAAAGAGYEEDEPPF